MFEDEDPAWDRWEDALAPMVADSWDDDPGFGRDEAAGGWVDREQGALGTLTTIVLVGTHVVDTVRRPVQGSGYECAALELRYSAPYLGAPVAPRSSVSSAPAFHEVPHEVAVLEWLATVVGGEDALDALDAEPLADEPLDTSRIRAGLLLRVETLSAEVDAVIEPLLGVEARTAARRVLAAAVRADPGLLLRSERDDIMVGGIVHAVARANDLVGAGHSITASALQVACGLRSSPRDRAAAVARAVRGPLWALPRAPHASGLPDVLVLGSPHLLVSAFRSALITVRDRARAQREA